MKTTGKLPQLHIIADANIWGAEHAFSSFEGFDVHLQILEHHDITASSVKNADILLVRSSSKINQSLLDGSKVRFVGTATIGDDHVDKAYLKSQGIQFASAAGSSTESVVEYILASFFLLEQVDKISFTDDTLGIIGVGRIGFLLDSACEKIGFKTLANDPPRQLQEDGGHFYSLDDLLENADVLTLHTPLTKHGEFQTTHLLGEDELGKFKGKGIINAGRGPCLDNHALLHWLQENSNRFAVLDCWEAEPNISLELLNHPQVFIASPHIAGHSLDGKAANTFFVYRDLCDFVHVKSIWDINQDLPEIEFAYLQPHWDKQQLSQYLYPIQQDTESMKVAGQQAESFTTWFQQYRRHYPVRRSWKKTLAAHPNYQEDLFF